jgi:hypothetical protein
MSPPVSLAVKERRDMPDKAPGFKNSSINTARYARELNELFHFWSLESGSAEEQ